MSTVRQALAAARARLAALPDADPDLDARVLMAHCLERDPSWLYAWPEAVLEPAQQARYDALVARRAAGEPVAHLTARREFWGLDLAVSPDTLIPRPDTELLVETALALGDARAPLTVLDLGTGSGAIALALAHERPHWRVIASDASTDALAVARRNAVALDLPQVEFRHGDWFGAIAADERFDLILSNPPYLADDDPHLERGDVRHEPRRALIAGRHGLEDLRHLIAEAPQHLRPGGWLLLEHGWEQGPAVRDLLHRAGLADVGTRRDLAGHERLGLGRLRARDGDPTPAT